MSDEFLIEFQKRENNAHNVSILKCFEVHALERDIEQITDPDLARKVQSDLNRARDEWHQSITKYLEAKIETARAAKKSLFQEFGLKDPKAFEQIVAPTWDKRILEAENELERHLLKYKD